MKNMRKIADIQPLSSIREEKSPPKMTAIKVE